MYQFNHEQYYIQEIDEYYYCIFCNESDDVYFINSTSKYVLDKLNMIDSVQKIVSAYVADYEIDLEETPFEQILQEFQSLITELVDHGIVKEISNVQI